MYGQKKGKHFQFTWRGGSTNLFTESELPGDITHAKTGLAVIDKVFKVCMKAGIFTITRECGWLLILSTLEKFIGKWG